MPTTFQPRVRYSSPNPRRRSTATRPSLSATRILKIMLVLGPSSEAEMIACFLGAELTSTRFGPAIRSALAANGRSECLLTHPDLGDADENAARRALLALTRGYGEHRELFDVFPDEVAWIRAELTPAELAAVRYMDYSYWI